MTTEEELAQKNKSSFKAGMLVGALIGILALLWLGHYQRELDMQRIQVLPQPHQITIFRCINPTRTAPTNNFILRCIR